MRERPFTVLYAEDEEDDIIFMKKALRAVAPEVDLVAARDGQHAVDYLSTHPPPDWVILDLKMPRRSGLEVLEWIRKESRFRDLKVTVFSSSPEQSDVERVRQLGIEEYIVKPISFAELQAVAWSMCRRWGVR